MPKDSDLEHTSFKGHFFLRGKGNGKAMMIGILEEMDFDMPNEGEIWLIDFLILDRKRYETPEYFKGKRADQILCMAVPLGKLVEIAPKD